MSVVEQAHGGGGAGTGAWWSRLKGAVEQAQERGRAIPKACPGYTMILHELIQHIGGAFGEIACSTDGRSEAGNELFPRGRSKHKILIDKQLISKTGWNYNTYNSLRI
ncbi:MAG: hypothetical protein WC716_11910 [Chitinophagaceae bacterium]|jgi:hypothetical protein